jgi:1-acyl-sn-glycerol-3-phosphate acyltransferase
MQSQTSNSTPLVNPFIKPLLWASVWMHVLNGILTLCIYFPFITTKSKYAHIRRWSSKLLNIFGIQLQVVNTSILPNTPYLLVSNHISWLDIHAINSFQPIRFVAKSEVESWPIFGWMAKQLGTIFIKRGSSRNAAAVVKHMAQILQTESICIFPEGTSTEGKNVKPFKANLFESAVMSSSPVYGLAIQYFDLNTGLRSDVAAFVGDMGLLESMSRILSHRKLRIELTFLAPSETMPNSSRDRKWLAMHSQEQISSVLSSK